MYEAMNTFFIAASDRLSASMSRFFLHRWQDGECMVHLVKNTWLQKCDQSYVYSMWRDLKYARKTPASICVPISVAGPRMARHIALVLVAQYQY